MASVIAKSNLLSSGCGLRASARRQQARLPARALNALPQQQQPQQAPVQQEVHHAQLPALLRQVAVSSVAASTLLSAGNANAASEMLSLAAGPDSRVALLGGLFVPVLGWVAFNIFGPLLRQLDVMSDKKLNSVAPAIGLAAASMLVAQSADAAELSQLADGPDKRVLLLATLFLPVLGWVAFNIFGPLLRQLSVMSDKKAGAVSAGLGLGALLAAQSADAAELSQLADGPDKRVLLLATLFVPVLGWVAFNIFGPLLRQLSVMAEKKED